MAIPRWLLGRHLTAVTIIPLTVASDGTYTLGTSGSIIGQVDSVELRETPAKENISSVNSTQAHNVILEDNSSINLTEILKTTGNVLPLMAVTADAFKIIFTRGRGTFTFFGSRGELQDGIKQKGKNTVALGFDQIDPGDVAPLVYIES